MVFSSITFLFFFLPVALGTSFFAGKWKNLSLFLTSLVFYCWGEGIYLLLILSSIIFNYIMGLGISRQGNRLISTRTMLSFAICCNFAMLGFFKYANFLTDNINVALASLNLPVLHLEPVHLPIGISFFTFMAVSYLLDIHKGKIEAQKNPINVGLYLTLFPHLIAGPIVRYIDIALAIKERTVTSNDFSYGVQRFVFGLGKKVLIANPVSLVADQIFALPATDLSLPLAWLGAVCYTFQIYYDFSGYSDMAIGLARMFGFTFLENFNYPYISQSIQEFWRRWHISLSTWFRDYLYIPLGGNRKGTARTALNLITVFSLCGLWHGASWTFICWGLYHGLFLAMERGTIGKLQAKLWRPVRHSLTLCIIIVGWVFFRSDNIQAAFTFIRHMLTPADTSSHLPLAFYLNTKLSCELIIASIFATPLLPALTSRWRLLAHPHDGQRVWQHVYTALACSKIAALSLILFLAVISLAAGVYNPFIYYRF